MTPHIEGIRKGTVIPPEDGWEDHAIYLVDAAFEETNVIHRAIMGISFVPKNEANIQALSHPNNWLMGGYENLANPGELYYLKAVKKLADGDEVYLNTYPENYKHGE